jgi:hypothetical protein
MLLCADIDFSALASGVARPGSRLISQVWAKRVADGAVAVLLLNADTNRTQSLSVDVASLGLQGGAAYTVRDVWQKADIGGASSLVVAPGNFTAHSIPAQDSRLLLFAPSKGVHAEPATSSAGWLAAGFSFSRAPAL